MKTYYVDFDDVLCETAALLTDIIQEEFGKGVPYEEIHSFDLADAFGLDDAESRRLLEIFHEERVLAGMKPVAGAAEALRVWQDAGIFIHIVTGRPPATCQASRAWLETHAMPYNRLSFVDKYGRNHVAVDDADIITLDELKKMPFDIAVDDSPMAIEFLVKHTNIPVAVFERPWNRKLGDLESDRQIIRCKSWQDVLACANSF